MNGSSGENAYTILETIHKSQHHCVYKAKNYFKGYLVTIKTNEQRWKTDPILNQQLRKEADTGLRLKHPNIQETTGLFEDEGAVYMVSKYIEGDSLSSLLGLSRLEISYDNALKWTLQLLDALDYAHLQRIIHLNLNPANIIITPDYNLVIHGFGKSPEDWKTADPDKDGNHPVLFVPPELFQGESTDERSDLYSVGVLAYLLFCGQLPWTLDRKDNPSQQKRQTFQRPAINPELLGKRVPHWLFNILNKSLMLDPAKRFASAGEMKQAIIAKQDVPYESCLNRAIQKTVPQSITLESFPDLPKPVPQPDSEPLVTLDTELPKPVQDTPTPKIKAENIPVPQASNIPPSTPKPPIRSNKPGYTQAEKAEVSQMRYLFRILGIVSLLILGYIIVKYLIITDTPSFSKVDKESLVDANESEFKTANKNIPTVIVVGDTTVIGHIGPDAEDDEFPPRDVKVPSFYIGIHEVTKEQWAMVTPGFVVDDREKDLPITRVSFYEALDFCNEKSRRDGYKQCYEFFGDDVSCDFTADGYRLPTEAEWEFAAKSTRSGNFTLYSGSTSPDDAGWFAENSDGKQHPVGEKNENLLGVFDMSGNVYEWIWNWYGRYSYNSDTAYSGPESGTDKVIRGGSWKHSANEMRVTNRSFAKPLVQSDYIGFRVVRTK